MSFPGNIVSEAPEAEEDNDLLWDVCVAPLSSHHLADAFAKVQARGEDVTRVVLHPVDYADVLKLGHCDLLSSGMTAAETSLMLETGVYPKKLWGAEVVRDLDQKKGLVVVRGVHVTVHLEMVRY